MKTVLSRPCSLMATLTVVTALPYPDVIFISGSAVKRPVMVTVFILCFLSCGLVLERSGSGGKAERQGCPKGRGEVLAGPVTVSERGVEENAASAVRSCPQP